MCESRGRRPRPSASAGTPSPRASASRGRRRGSPPWGWTRSSGCTIGTAAGASASRERAADRLQGLPPSPGCRWTWGCPVSPRVLVTGASGFVGAAVVRDRAGRAGPPVTALCRAPSSRLGSPGSACSTAIAVVRCRHHRPPALAATAPRSAAARASTSPPPVPSSARTTSTSCCAVNAAAPAHLARALAAPAATVPGDRRLHLGVRDRVEGADGRARSRVPPRTPTASRSSRAASSRASPSAARALRTAHLRLFSVYGPGEDARRLVPAVDPRTARRAPGRPHAGRPGPRLRLSSRMSPRALVGCRAGARAARRRHRRTSAPASRPPSAISALARRRGHRRRPRSAALGGPLLPRRRALRLARGHRPCRARPGPARARPPCADGLARDCSTERCTRTRPGRLAVHDDRAHEIRELSLELALRAGTCHIGSALGIADILAVAYFAGDRARPTRSSCPRPTRARR